MKRSKALLLRAMIERASASLSDTDALEAVELFKEWKAGISVKIDDRLKYKDMLYTCLQSHTTQSDWTPDITPALWKKTG